MYSYTVIIFYVNLLFKLYSHIHTETLPYSNAFVMAAPL